MGAKLCPLNVNLCDHGGYCVQELCEWWVTGTERSEVVHEHEKDYFCQNHHEYDEGHTNCCNTHCQPKTITGPGTTGGSCAMKALAVEAHDIQVELREAKHDLACLLHALAHVNSTSKAGQKP